MDIPAALTRKIGPLPVWAWGGVVGGSVLAFRALTGGSSASPSPTQVTPGAPIEGDGGSGSGGGSGETPQPWYAQVPGVGTIIDRPPGDVTIIPAPKPPSSTTPPPTTTPPAKVYWGKDIPTAISKNFSGASAAAVFRKYKVNYGGAINLVDIAALFKKAGIHPKTRTAGLTKLGVRRITPTGDTFAYAEGDDWGTPLTPQAIVPSAPILPLGQLPAAPTFSVGVYRGYLGPSIDAVTPIASSARIAMPPINGDFPMGTVLRAALPKGIEKAKPPRNRSRWTRGVPRITIDPIERIATPVRLAVDRRISPKRLGTTVRLPTPAAQQLTTALDTRTGRNISG